MRALAVLCCVAATCLQAQQPPQPPPAPQPTQSPTSDSARAESARTPLPPNPEQQRFLGGLRTATRGIAQLKDGLNRVARAQAAGDSASQRRAGRSFAGLCGSARTFMRRGRPSLKPTVYSDSVQLVARRLVTQLDSLIAFTASCEQSAVSAPGPAASDLGKRMKTYDLALRDFRLAIGLPVKEDTAKTTKRP